MSEQRLCQVLAIVAGVKSRVEREVTAKYHTAQKPDLFNGFARIYTPKNEDGEKQPTERKAVQQRVADVFRVVRDELAELFDVAASRDWANCQAVSDIVLDGKVLVQAVPATYLLFLEKQLQHIRAVVNSLPVLDPAETWTIDPTDGLWKTAPTEAVRTQKVPRAIVMTPTTKEHPGTSQLIADDIVVGSYETVKFSGALPPAQKELLLYRVERLQKAVKFAREKANLVDAPVVEVGEKLLGYLFG